MLDPLLSDKTDQSCLTLTFPAATTSTTAAASGGCVEGVFIKTGVPREKFYGSNATYSIPSKRLADIDASFVYLTLDPFGHSDNHHHPGDELLIVLNGSVTIVFADSGTHVRLEKGAYAHFYAEQNHSAWNTSEDVAEVFIIRFYQLRVPATRQEMRQDLWRTVAQRSHPITSGTFDRLTWGWIIEAAAGRHTPLEANIPREISNPFGLARLLGSATPPSKTQGNRLLSRIKGATGQEFRSLSHWLWQLETAQVKVPTTLLPAIAKTYNIFDLLLLEFVFPAITSHVVVHRSGIPSDTTNHHEQVTLSACLPSGWAAMGDVSGYISAVGVTYEIPRRTLACSDIAITWLTLEPGHVTTFNQHTGSELILLFEGCVSIEYGNHGDSICCLSALQHCAHYKSNIKHRVCNYGDTPAQMLVVRFYGGHEELKAKVRHRHAR
jgi:quercetin dioxygenase-like cupin family protein